jgi:hypothetical protein
VAEQIGALRAQDGTRLLVRLGDGSPLHAERVQLLRGPEGANLLSPYYGPGGPARLVDAYELLRREVNAHARVLDGLAIGFHHSSYAGNLAAINLTRSKHTLAQHLVDPLSDASNPIPPALEIYQSILSERRPVAGIRPVLTIGRWGRGNVTQGRALILLEKRLADGATDEGAWIEDVGREFSIQAGGTIFSRGGLLLFGQGANAVIRGGSLFAEDGGALASLGPGVTSDDATGTSIALVRLSGTAALLGDIYGNDIEALTIQGSVRALKPSGADTYFRSKGLIVETDGTRPTFFTAGNRGLWWNTASNKATLWNGTIDTEISGGVNPLLDAVNHTDTVASVAVRGDVITAVTSPAPATPANPRWNRMAKGTSGQQLTAGALDLSWASPALLSASHGDTLAAAPVRGDVMVGNATPQWARLPGGTNGQVLTIVGADPTWSDAGVRTLKKTADQTITGSNYVDVTGLSFSVAANTDYAFEFYLACRINNAAFALTISMNGPAGATVISYAVDHQVSANGSSGVDAFRQVHEIVYDSTTWLTFFTTANADFAVKVKGRFKNGAVAGTLAVRCRADDVASSVSVRKGSWGTYF